MGSRHRGIIAHQGRGRAVAAVRRGFGLRNVRSLRRRSRVPHGIEARGAPLRVDSTVRLKTMAERGGFEPPEEV